MKKKKDPWKTARREFRIAVEKIFFVFMVELVLLTDIFLIRLLKMTHRFKERELEPFPRNKKGLIVVMNHPDGNEWLFIYRHFFKPIYWLKPWRILKELPYALANKVNFARPILRVVAMALVFVIQGKGKEISGESTIRKSLRILEDGIPLIGFFEGGRTWKRTDLVYSKQKHKPLGKLNESLGFLVKKNHASVKVGWIDYQGCDFHSLPPDGKFRLAYWWRWYWLTLRGKNGKIVLLWGKVMTFETQNKAEINLAVENYMLELADEV